MDANIENTFTRIYKTGEWKAPFGTESGPGSVKQLAKKYFAFLTSFVKRNNIQTILDLGCGDFNLMKHFDFTSVTYTGVDAVKHVIDSNVTRYSASNISFVHADITTHISEQLYDLVIIKDVLQHLSNDQIIQTVKNINYAKYILVYNDFGRNTPHNNSIRAGECRTINLQKPPFSFKTEPLMNVYTINEFRRAEIIFSV